MNPLTALYIYIYVCVCSNVFIYIFTYPFDLFVLSGNNWLSSLYIVGYPYCVEMHSLCNIGLIHR